MPYSLLPIPKIRFWNAAGTAPLAGGKVYAYSQGTSTPKNTYTDNTGTALNPHPVVLDANGEAAIWLSGFYKIILKDYNDVTQWTVDNVSSMPADSSVAYSEWLSNGLTPTYISTASFSVPGDETSRFHVGRRVKAIVSAGTVYGTIRAASYSAGISTITVTIDSGDLDSGLSTVYESVIGAANTSSPALYSFPAKLSTTQRDTFTAVNGWLLYNSTSGRHQVRRGGAYLDVVDTDSTDILTNKTLTLPKILTTGAIVDGGGDKYLEFVETATPVNYLRVEQSNTGAGPKISAQGTDANIDLQLEAKGTGLVKLGKIVGALDTAKVKDTSYLAATDLIVTAYVTSDNTDGIEALTDSANPPTTIIAKDRCSGTAGQAASVFMVVRKGDYWKVAHVTPVSGTVVVRANSIG